MSVIASHSPLNISLEMKVWFQGTTNRKSNGHVTDDVTGPWTVNVLTPTRLGSISRKQLEMLF